jgi:hypothetical protein
MRRGILASRDELVALRERTARKPFDGIYEALCRRCALILETPPVSEAQWRTLWEHGHWSSAVEAARTAQGRILDLLIAHHIDHNLAYRDRAIEELVNLTGWSTWVDPCHNHLPADLCTAEAAVAAAVGLDWLWEDLPQADRLRALEAIRTKAIQPYLQAVAQQTWWYTCYHNWNAVTNSGCGLAALALGDEEPAAEEAYRLAMAGLEHFFDALGREGGWDEGTGYWGYAMRYVLLLGEAAWRLIDDRRIFHRRGMDATGLFGVYFTPNGQPASFGDNPAVPLYGTLYLLAKHFGEGEVLRWLDTYAFHRDAATTGWASEGLALLFRPADADPPREVGLAPVKVFHEIGWAALADRWPRPGMYVAAKAGDLAANHSQRDMNSLQLQVDGEMLLIDLGHGPLSREYFSARLSSPKSDARGEFYEVQACAHNTVTVGERDHQIDARGEIIEADSGENFHWIAADAETACGDTVRFIRHVVMVTEPPGRGRMVVVVDELSDTEEEIADLMWHTQGQLHLDAAAGTGTISGTTASLHFALAAYDEESRAACGEQGRAACGERSRATDAAVTAETAPPAGTGDESLVASGVESLVASRVEPPARAHGDRPRRTHNILHVSAPISGKLVLVSVFSREPLGAPLRITEGPGDGLIIHAGPPTLRFKTRKSRLHLQQVSVK